MISKMKGYFGLLLTVIIVMGISTMTFASDQMKISNDEGISVIKNQQLDEVSVETNESISPMAWPGSGAAAQVTSVELHKAGWLKNGNLGVRLKVYGYGRDNTTFDGRSISWFERDLFTDFGTIADGSYYTYDCGPLTEGNTYTFETTFTSINFPYSQKSLSVNFTY